MTFAKMTFAKTTPLGFIHDLRFDDLPAPVVAQAKARTLDLVGVAASGRRTALSDIACRFAVSQLGTDGPGARLLFDGRRAGPAGAAFAGAATIDAFDAHDGHALTKGHVGVTVLPALLAVADSQGEVDGRDLIAALVVGYEVATRAGIALHASAADYHTSGAWNALGAAALGARLLRLSPAATREALGIAEYHGPRSQMMRCIDHPTMVKDGSGWGALAGVSAAYLAADGFTGAPALTVEADAHAALWGDLGDRWRILEQYDKPFPVCRWAQPAMEAAAALLHRHAIPPERIAAVAVHTFAHAVRLGTHAPATTEEAQYALGFPLAALLAKGRVDAAAIAGAGLHDPATLAMLARITLHEDVSYSARFPAERVARVVITLDDERRLVSDPTTARGDPETPLAEAELRAKFHALADAVSRARREAIEAEVESLDGVGGAQGLIDLLAAPLAHSGLKGAHLDGRSRGKRLAV